MDIAIDYWIEFWGKFVNALNDMELSNGVSLLGVLVGAIVIVTIIAFAFGQKKGVN